MGVFRSAKVEDYWCRSDEFPRHHIASFMGQKEFEQLKRYFHVSIPYRSLPRKQWTMRCWLLVPVMLVVTYVPWPGLVFLLADSGLYQGVVDEGCEVEHGGKRADKGEGQRADGGDAGSVGQRRGEGGGCAILVYI
jgi:hypothetical protein